jgi:hypothetical protein
MRAVKATFSSIQEKIQLLKNTGAPLKIAAYNVTAFASLANAAVA